MRKHNVRGGTGSVSRTLHGDADVGALEGGGVVDTVARHTAAVANLTQAFHDEVLVLGENLSEAARGNNKRGVFVHKIGGHRAALAEHRQTLGALDESAHTQLARSLHRHHLVVTGDHLDLHTQHLGVGDGLLGVGAGRIQESEDAKEPPRAVLAVLAAHGQRADAAGAELVHLLLHVEADLLLVGTHVEDNVRGTLGDGEDVAVGAAQLALGLLGAGIERGEVNLSEGVKLVQVALTLLQIGLAHNLGGAGALALGIAVRRRLGPLGELEAGLEHHGVERVAGGLLPLGRESRLEQHSLLVLVGSEGGAVVLDHHLVEGEGASLVRAEHVHAGHTLNGGEAGDDSAVAREHTRAHGQGGCGHNLDSQGDGRHEHNDRERQRLLDNLLVCNLVLRSLIVVLAVAHNDKVDEGGTAEAEREGHQHDHHLHEKGLKTAARSIHSLKHSSSFTEEGVLSSGFNGAFDLSTSDRGTHLAHISVTEFHRQGLASHCGLINFNLSLVDVAIRGNGGAGRKQNQVTRYNCGGIHVLPLSIALDGREGFQGCFQRSNSIAGL
mmetsp:Transcript_53296/g.141191  ORF Transcript_53296/g.141191 Transcript_53296/m.141191 type:complete len:554 (+) Transcript_53296:1836-3497(+)